LNRNTFGHWVSKLRRSKKAMALPATFLILFVSTLGLISVTYYFAIEKVNARSQVLKVSTAKQAMTDLDDTVMSVVWQPGSARRFDMPDSGGRLRLQPTNCALSIGITDERDINQTVFAQVTGQVVYELPYSDSPETGLYLEGDSRTLTNQSGGSISQLFIQSGEAHPEILLRYRPAVSCAVMGEEDGKAVNIMRIFVVNLNSSDVVSLHGELPLRVSCESTNVEAYLFSLSYSLETITVTSTIDGYSGSASIPVSSGVNGAIIKVEVVQCSITIARRAL
jgi:hypothetical protein